MELIRFRRANKLSLSELAVLLGLNPGAAGNLSKIEHGEHIPTPELTERIYLASLSIGPSSVQANDHHHAWLKAHPQVSRAIRRLRRTAVIAFRSRHTPKEGSNGRKK
jgi:transcriptional regulator with XRE-family HTH domain